MIGLISAKRTKIELIMFLQWLLGTGSVNTTARSDASNAMHTDQVNTLPSMPSSSRSGMSAWTSLSFSAPCCLISNYSFVFAGLTATCILEVKPPWLQVRLSTPSLALSAARWATQRPHCRWIYDDIEAFVLVVKRGSGVLGCSSRRDHFQFLWFHLNSSQDL